MSETTQEKTPDKLTVRLLNFYDNFSEFNDYCAFLCDAFASVATQPGDLEDCSAHGLKRSAQWMKERMGMLKADLDVIQKDLARK